MNELLFFAATFAGGAAAGALLVIAWYTDRRGKTSSYGTKSRLISAKSMR